MSSMAGGVVALVVGAGLAVATVLGLVSSRSATDSGTDTNVQSEVIDYGTNAG